MTDEPQFISRCGECGGDLDADHRCVDCGTQHNGPEWTRPDA